MKAVQEDNKKLSADLKKSQEAEKKAIDLSDSLKSDSEADIQSLKDSHAEEIEGLNSQIASLNDVIKELNEALEAKDSEVKSLGKRPVFKSGKKQIELRIKKFIHNFKGERIEVDQKVLESNPELVTELLNINSAALREIGGK